MVAFVAGQEGVAGPLHVLTAGLLGQLLGLVNVDLPQVTDVLRAGLVAQFGGAVVIELESRLGGLHLGGQHDVGDALFGGPHQRVAADHAGEPDGRMGLLVGAHPRVDVAEVEVLALPAEGAGGGPRLDDQLVGPP